MHTLEDITKAIMADPENKEFTEQGIKPLFAAPKNARINIVGQAPGLKTQEAGLYWKDKSGDRLREWLSVDEEMFYNSGYFAVLPMDFYFPGHGKSGDLPPRKDFADKWPDFFPLVHPSPRNQIWMAKNPWFAEQVVPDLQALVQKIIHQ